MRVDYVLFKTPAAIIRCGQFRIASDFRIAAISRRVPAMGKQYQELDDRLQDFIRRQRMFFVGSAPLEADGHINLSPKGFDTFRILDSRTVAYLDYMGSGVESIAHLKQNGRFVILFCSFDKAPLIVRLHGTGEVIERGDSAWEALAAEFQVNRLARSIIRVSLDRITDSCGWGVPMFNYVGERDQFAGYEARKDDDGLRHNQKRWNLKSIDGLPGLSKPSL